MSLSNYYIPMLSKDLEDIMALNCFIRNTLKKNKMKQKDMAEEIGMTKEQISRLCVGKKTSFKTLRIIANYFDLDYDTIVKMAIKADMI